MAPVADLTESQIDRLLREAEERLAEKTGQVAAAAAAAAKSTPFEVAVAKAAKKEADAAALVAAGAPVPKAGATAVKKADGIDLRIASLADKKDKSFADRQKNPDTAGADWYNLPKTVLTPEAKRDFQILRMRGVLDTKQHFRKDTRKDMYPAFSVFGTIVEGTAKGETDRLSRKERKRTIAEEVLASQAGNKVLKKRSLKIQEKSQSGRKGFYKKLVAGRRRT